MGRKPVLTRVPDRLHPRVGAADTDSPVEEEMEDYGVAEPGEADDSSGNDSAGADEAGEADLPRGLEMHSERVRMSPAVLVLEVLGREIRVRDGDTLGREIRTAMVEGGAPEDEAILVHREHARVDVVDGLVLLERLGENSLRVNGREVIKGERVRVTDGDAVTFSGVVTAEVHTVEEDAGAAPQPSGRSMSDGQIAHTGAVDAGLGMHHSLDILIHTIPGEVLVLWAALDGATDLYSLPVWASGVFLGLAVIATPVYVHRSIDTPDEMSSEGIDRWWQEANVRWQSVSATGAFLVWVYYLGGPFQAIGLQNPALATVLVIIYPILMVISPYYGSLVIYYVSNFTGERNRGQEVR